MENTILGFLTSATDVVTNAFESCWSLAVSNPLIAFGLGVSVLLTGLGVFGALKQSI